MADVIIGFAEIPARAARALLIAALAVLIPGGGLRAEETKPIWEYVPSTISPEWGPVLEHSGKNRDLRVPAPDDIDGWKKL